MRLNNYYIIFILWIAILGCSKDFLDKKPNSSIVVPKTLNELQALLENHSIMNLTGGLAQISSDEYTIPLASSYVALRDQTAKNSYIWSKDLYGGQAGIQDWNSIYKIVFYANNVLEEIDKDTFKDKTAFENLKGWALFSRSYAFFNLVSNFSPVYNTQTADSDLGVPLRTTPGVDYVAKRATSEETFNLIVSDLNKALLLLQKTVATTNPNRPSKPAAYALLARIHLYMGNYGAAEAASDSCLKIYDRLIDFNTLSLTSAIPIGYVNDETLFFSSQVPTYADLTNPGSAAITRVYSVANEVVSSYTADDLRSKLFFNRAANGNYNIKRRYTAGNTPFTGLTTNEVYLIKAECLARRNELSASMTYLKTLLDKRFKPNTYIQPLPSTKEEALQIVLTERRKELLWRGLRWYDLKRLNREGAGIVLSRTVDGVSYSLPPNDPRYVFPIPDDEISMTGIEQNIR
ncbi:RagB/SusD family nutrient uptake outer membrane protein [Pedobacter nyackensis]|uniref:SusD family protein n=1 Tax=Pedobacter nyackensis TaxID=475255 RepID=A0A1W2EFA7_9SPHI|nr:RagB/SusD family nutrient uptake outer membrane protein [Pedobacter nyackensis]SMD08460.1 SusD family protein [Pedobacter nyackensis]